jgi:hypothetical protein
MKRKFVAADLNSDGMVDSAELNQTKLLDSKARLEDFDIMTIDDQAGLDSYEYQLLLIQHDEFVQDQLHHESGADIKWSRAVALRAATHIVLLGDDNMDGMLSMEEAGALYGCTNHDFDLILHLRGRFMALDTEQHGHAEDMEHDGPGIPDEWKRTSTGPQQTQVAQLLVSDISKVIYGMMAAIFGDKWADDEHRKGFSVVEAVRLAVKLADYNNDGFLSRAESALLTMPQELFSALSPAGADGKQLSVEDIFTALETVSACDEVLVVDRPGEISLKTLYMPRGKCSLLIMPRWNHPASYAQSDEGPSCPGKGSESGDAGAAKRRLLAHGKMGKTETARKSPRASSPSNTAASRTSRGKHKGGDKKPQAKFAKFATRNILRSVVAKHPLASTLSNAGNTASKATKHHNHYVEKRMLTAKAVEARRNQQLQKALKRLRSKRPASRARALGPSRRADMEQAMAKSMEQSVARLVTRGAQARLSELGMRAYRRAVKTNSGSAARAWLSLKGALKSMRVRMQHTDTQGEGTQQQQQQRGRLRRQDVRKTAKSEALRVRAFAKASMVQNNEWPVVLDRLLADDQTVVAVQRQTEDEHAERKLAASIEREMEIHNEYLEKLGQAPVSIEVFMEIMVKAGMPGELADMLFSHLSLGLSSPGTGMEDTEYDFGFVARVSNGCTLLKLAMNYSTGKDYNKTEARQLPYCGLPWTVGQRVVQEMDSDDDGVISSHETCISPADFAKVAGFGKRRIGAHGQGGGLSSSEGAPSSQGVGTAEEAGYGGRFECVQV